jgi:hypothetical protein
MKIKDFSGVFFSQRRYGSRLPADDSGLPGSVQKAGGKFERILFPMNQHSAQVGLFS